MTDNQNPSWEGWGTGTEDATEQLHSTTNSLLDPVAEAAYRHAVNLSDDDVIGLRSSAVQALDNLRYDAEIPDSQRDTLEAMIGGHTRALDERARARLDGRPDPVSAVAGFRALSLGDLAQFEFPPVEWIVDELFPAGALVLLVGRPKAGKSLLAVDLLASVALGETFLDRATAQGAAIYVPAEDALRLVRDRLWTRLDSERTAPLFVVPADGTLEQSIRIDDPASMARLRATIEEIRPALLVLDPMRELHTRKENDADEMAAVLRPLRQLAHDTGTTIILIHHRNKHATDASLATRGSSAIAGGVDVIITLDLSDESDSAELTPAQVMTLRVEGRYGPRQAIGARLRAGLRWESADPQSGDSLTVRDRIRRHFEVTGDHLTADQLHEVIGGDKSGLQRALRDLLGGGRIVRDGAGTKIAPYRYSVAVHESFHEYSRAQTEKTGDSWKAQMVYTPADSMNPSKGNKPPKCRSCGANISIINTSGLCGRCVGQAAADD